MPYNPKKFTVLGISDAPSEDKPTGGKPFTIGSQAAIDLLESILPVEKAQAVPYALIWEINPVTGKAMHAREDGSPSRPLSSLFAEPPRFGSSLSVTDSRFRERPPVSLERISIKTQNPRSIILYKTLELSFVVHRPETVFDQHIEPDGTHKPGGDSWSSIITPGQAFALEYGWSASPSVKNGILNGEGHVESSKGVAIQGRDQIRFVVTNYTFQIMPDSQLKFTVQGIELGESNLRQAFIVSDKKKDKSQPTVKAKVKKEVDPHADGGLPLQELLKKFQDGVAGSSEVKKEKKKGATMVPFGLVIDVIFADLIEKAYNDMGFEFKKLFVGTFNARAGKPAYKYSAGSDMSGKPISDFTFPLDDVEKIFSDLMKTGARLTMYNFIQPFLRIFSSTVIWDRKGEKNNTERTIPQIVMRTISRRNRAGKIEVYYYIFDVNAVFANFTKDDAKKLPNENVTRSDIKKVVNDKGVPFISLVRANSFIKDASFDTIQDEQMKGIFIRRYFGDQGVNRTQKTANPDVASKEDRAPAAQQVFSPVIKGKITMIGNFVLDTFGLIWLDFGISLWDGPFTLAAREDVIERGDFTTTLSVFSNATDPLGTKSRRDVI
jgi:hypothetical protein